MEKCEWEIVYRLSLPLPKVKHVATSCKAYFLTEEINEKECPRCGKEIEVKE